MRLVETTFVDWHWALAICVGAIALLLSSAMRYIWQVLRPCRVPQKLIVRSHPPWRGEVARPECGRAAPYPAYQPANGVTPPQFEVRVNGRPEFDFALQVIACVQGRVGSVRKYTIDAETKVSEIFFDGVALYVVGQIVVALFAAKCIFVHKQTCTMSVRNQ